MSEGNGNNPLAVPIGVMYQLQAEVADLRSRLADAERRGEHAEKRWRDLLDSLERDLGDHALAHKVRTIRGLEDLVRRT